MKVLTALCIFLLSGLASCYNKRQSPCSCTNARQAAIATCSIPDSLFPLPEPIPPFGNVLGSIAGRVDGASILNSICTSYSCYSSLEILYSCCMVSTSGPAIICCGTAARICRSVIHQWAGSLTASLNLLETMCATHQLVLLDFALVVTLMLELLWLVTQSRFNIGTIKCILIISEAMWY